MYRQIIIDKNGKEMNMPLDESFPVWGMHDTLQNYVHQYFLPHWHPEIEISFIKQGEISYTLQEDTIILKQGEGVAINANTLHGGSRLSNSKGCELFVLRMDPIVLGPKEGRIYQNYVAPFLQHPSLPYVLLKPEIDWQKELLAILQEIAEWYQNNTGELTLLACLCRFWDIFASHVKEPSLPIGTYRNIDRIRLMCNYIQMHLQDKITLQQLCDSASICKSECCRLFKEIFHQTPIQYINTCRIQQSLPLIAQGQSTMSEIASQCGFSNSSYFAETFLKVIGMTPSAYQRQCHMKESMDEKKPCFKQPEIRFLRQKELDLKK